MKSDQERRRQVTDLAEYRKQKNERKASSCKDPAKILDEVSYYLLMAAKAMSSRQNK